VRGIFHKFSGLLAPTSGDGQRCVRVCWCVSGRTCTTTVRVKNAAAMTTGEANRRMSLLSKSQAIAPAGSSSKGDVASTDLGKFRLGALLGKGAFGQVVRPACKNIRAYLLSYYSSSVMLLFACRFTRV
jgi:hypothetical protein